MTRALKFLRPGRIGPFTGAVWPQPGSWLETSGELSLCRSGVHALRLSALPFWLAEKLWRVELEGAHEPADGVLLARRGRLIEPIAAWNDETARRYAESCLDALPEDLSSAVARTRRSHAEIGAREVSASPSAAWIGYVAAQTLETERPGAYIEERKRQAAWLREHLGLEEFKLSATD
jgi:hypothetical protein